MPKKRIVFASLTRAPRATPLQFVAKLRQNCPRRSRRGQAMASIATIKRQEINRGVPFPGRNGNRSGQVENRPSLRPGSHLGQPLSVLDCTRREPRSESNYYSFPLQPVPGKTTLYNAGIYTAGKT